MICGDETYEDCVMKTGEWKRRMAVSEPEGSMGTTVPGGIYWGR